MQRRLSGGETLDTQSSDKIQSNPPLQGADHSVIYARRHRLTKWTRRQGHQHGSAQHGHAGP